MVRITTLAASMVLVALMAAEVSAQELQQIVFGAKGTCENYQLVTQEIYDNEGAPLKVVKSRVWISAAPFGGGIYVSRGDGFILAFSHFGGARPHEAADKDVIPAGTTLTLPHEGYLYVTHWCGGTGPFEAWAFIEYTR